MLTTRRELLPLLLSTPDRRDSFQCLFLKGSSTLVCLTRRTHTVASRKPGEKRVSVFSLEELRTYKAERKKERERGRKKERSERGEGRGVGRKERKERGRKGGRDEGERERGREKRKEEKRKEKEKERLRGVLKGSG